MFTVQPLWLSRTELLLRTYNSHQINPKWGRNSHTWHKQKRWSSGWGCTDLRASCRMGTAPYRDLLVDKHTELCLRSLFLPPKKSLPLALWLSSAHSVSSWKCVLFNSMCFHWWLFSYLVPAFRSLLLAFIIFPLPFFFTYLLSRPPHPPSLPFTPLAFTAFSFGGKPKQPDAWGIWANGRSWGVRRGRRQEKNMMVKLHMQWRQKWILTFFPPAQGRLWVAATGKFSGEPR